MIEEKLTPYVCPRFLEDEKYRSGHIHILAPRPGTRILGLHTPEMKQIAKGFVKDGSWEAICHQFAGFSPVNPEGAHPLTHEERMIWGLMIDYAKVNEEKRFQLIRQFLPAIDNWAICDNFCCNSAWVEKADKEKVWDFLEELYSTPTSDPFYEFTVRVAIVLSMSHFLDGPNYLRTFERIASLGLEEGSPYYIRMAVAWLFATALAKEESATREFVKCSDLPKDIVRLYVRKARESFRTRNVPAL